MTKFAGLKAKSYSYLTDEGNGNEKAIGTKKYVIKRNIKFGNYKYCLEATQTENEINHLKKSNWHRQYSQRNHKEFIKNNKLLLKSQQRFKSESHNVFIEEINKIALSSNENKSVKSINSIETFFSVKRKRLNVAI